MCKSDKCEDQPLYDNANGHNQRECFGCVNLAKKAKIFPISWISNRCAQASEMSILQDRRSVSLIYHPGIGEYASDHDHR